jgi:hypothetical protein
MTRRATRPGRRIWPELKTSAQSLLYWNSEEGNVMDPNDEFPTIERLPQPPARRLPSLWFPAVITLVVMVGLTAILAAYPALIYP